MLFAKSTIRARSVSSKTVLGVSGLADIVSTLALWRYRMTDYARRKL